FGGGQLVVGSVFGWVANRPPLAGEQPKSLRLCQRMVTPCESLQRGGWMAVFLQQVKLSEGREHSMSKSTFAREIETPSIAGYDYGQAGVAHSPVSLEELRQLEQTVGWSDEDARTLERHGELFRENAEKMVDSWRAAIAA